ncbi:glycosyltransferase family 2 protein [Candidatus Saccharibacteria bacterium]|nr:glycosyltransferase family 2 protein [Candidatus Saccharibacteria bacterium]
MPKICILVLSFNALEYTKITIQSIFNSTVTPFYLLIVDNGSDIDVQTYLHNLVEQGACKGIIVCQNQENLGAARALNQGFSIAQKLHMKYLVKCDNDLYFWPGWLEQLLADLKAHPDIAMVSPLRISKYTKMHYGELNSKAYQSQLAARSMLPEEELQVFFGTHNLDDGLRQFISANKKDDRIISEIPGFVPGHCQLLSMETLQEIGYLADPRYLQYGSDDIDLCWEILKRKHKIYVDNQIFVYHFRHKSQPDNDERARILNHNNQEFYNKWQNDIELLKWDPLYYDKLHDDSNEDYDILRTMSKNWSTT